MHLRSRRSQIVNIPCSRTAIDFAEDETIWTESSHKFTADEIFWLARKAGFGCRRQWIDHEWPFAENLLVAE
jgi:L-histidine Nalpha-methyltransferase